jgi:hypothetical protein
LPKKRSRRLSSDKQRAGPEPDLIRLAVKVCRVIERLKIPGCCIGGVALQRWGEVRQTVDVDLTVLAPLGTEGLVIDQLLKQFQPRISEARQFAMETRVLLLQSDDYLGIDVSLGAFPYEVRVMERSSHWQVSPYGRIRTCSAEDLVVLKAFANRPQDWIDIERVIIRQGARLDRQLILQELTPLAELKEDPQILLDLQGIFHSSPH